jgi:hypothetical protein
MLKLIGVLSGGSAVVTGTGAFTSVEAERDVTIETADDSNALLAIDDTGNANAEYVTESGGELGIDITGSNATSNGGQGVNTDAVTVIGDLFEVQNQGTQTSDVEITPLAFVDSSVGTLIVLIVPQTNFPSVELSPGETETYDMVVGVLSGGSGTDLEIDDTMTVSGEAV